MIFRVISILAQREKCRVFSHQFTYWYNFIVKHSLLFVDPLPLRGAFFGSGSGPILLDNVVCRGTEQSLLQCNTNPVSENNCDHSEDAGVRCEGTSLQFSRYTQLKTKSIKEEVLRINKTVLIHLHLFSSLH